MPYNLIIADDHPILIQGLKNLLGELDDINIVATVSNGWELIDTLRRTAVDIVLLDLQMPRIDGIESLKILRKDFPALRVIVFTNFDQAKLVREIKSLGAHGYLLKDTSAAELKQAVLAVARGGSWFADAPETPVSSQLSNDFMKKYQLTSRETEIICQIAGGLTTKEIAAKLFVSEFTINTHRRNICRKLDIYTPVGLLNFAKEHGLVS